MSAPADRGDELLPFEYAVCSACGAASYYPRPVCPRCGHDAEPRAALLPATVYSLTTVHRAAPEFRDDAPFDVAFVFADAGFGALTRSTRLQIGDRCRLGVVRRADGSQLPTARSLD